MNNLMYDEDLLAELLAMHDQDPEQFMDLVMKVIRENPKVVIEDKRDQEKKLMALERIRTHYVDREEYENCAIIRDLEKKINEEA